MDEFICIYFWYYLLLFCQFIDLSMAIVPDLIIKNQDSSFICFLFIYLRNIAIIYYTKLKQEQEERVSLLLGFTTACKDKEQYFKIVRL